MSFFISGIVSGTLTHSFGYELTTDKQESATYVAQDMSHLRYEVCAGSERLNMIKTIVLSKKVEQDTAGELKKILVLDTCRDYESRINARYPNGIVIESVDHQ